MNELKELFGNSDEVKIWSVIVPYGLSNTISLEEVQRATSLPMSKVMKFFNKLDSLGIIIGKDRKMIKITNSTGRAIHQMIHAAYDDKLMRDQKHLLKGED